MTTDDSYEIIQHNIKVSQMAESFTRYMALSEETAKTVAVAGVFIDLGKIAMDYKVFTKKEMLTEQELLYIQQHASKSTEVLIQSNLISRDILACIIHHHEDFSGSGYPARVKGDAIPIGARILKICDVYLALTEKRPYREPFSHEAALQVMNDEAEKYDPALLHQFFEFIRK